MTRVLIVGGGVAGPVAAMALQRAGIQAVVDEAHAPTTDEEVGSYLTVATNGLDALRAIGADTLVLHAGFPTPTNLLLSSSGRRLGSSPTAGCCRTGPAPTPSSGRGCTGRCTSRRPAAASRSRSASGWASVRSVDGAGLPSRLIGRCACSMATRSAIPGTSTSNARRGIDGPSVPA